MSIKFISTSESIKNKALITIPWSLHHFWIGILTAIIFKYYGFSNKLNVILSFIIHLIYELKDYYYSHILKKYSIYSESSDSIINSIGDIIINLSSTILYLNLFKKKPTKITLTFSIILSLIFSHYCLYYHGSKWNHNYNRFLNNLNIL